MLTLLILALGLHCPVVPDSGFDWKSAGPVGGCAGATRVSMQTAGPTQTPPRDSVARPAGEGASLRGRVVDGLTGRPIARVAVRLTGREPRTTISDADGQFAFVGLSSGPMYLTAERSGYLPASFPERRRSVRTPAITLSDGQTLAEVKLALFRAGVIAGRVLDTDGEPIEGASLQAVRLSSPGRVPGRRSVVRGLPSNDIGEFRLPRLEPGTYVLHAVPPRRPSDQGELGLARVYYPGVASLDQAQPFTIEKGQTVTGLEFSLLQVRLTKISGTVATSRSEPLMGGRIQARVKAGEGMQASPDGGTAIRPNGTFELYVQAGEYVLEAAPIFQGGPQGQAPAPEDLERGLLPITVGTESISGVVVTTGRGATVAGRLIFEGRRPAPADLRRVGMGFQPKEGSSDICQAFAPPTVSPDGSFTARALWGACNFWTIGAPGWHLKSVMHRGTDITTRSIAFNPGEQISDVQVVFTDRVGELALDVSDDRGEAPRDYVAFVFPVEEALWGDPRYLRTYVASASRAPVPMFTAQAGGPGVDAPPLAFDRSGVGAAGGGAAIRGILPGQYLAVALDDIAVEDLRDPAVLSQLASRGIRVSMAEGESKPLQLRLVSLSANSR